MRGARETPEGSVLGNELVEIARRELENLPEQTSASPTNGIQPIDYNELVELVTAYRDGRSTWRPPPGSHRGQDPRRRARPRLLDAFTDFR
jgi:hypothetical protein